MNFNWFDYSIIAVILLSIAISFFRGFLREIISLIAWVAGLIFAMRFAPKAADYLNGIIATEMLRYIIAFVLLFLAVFVIGLFINVMIKRGVDATGLGLVDRILGGTFGAVRGILFVAVVLMFMTMSGAKETGVIADSTLSPNFMPLVIWLDSFLPQQFQHVKEWMSYTDSQDAQGGASAAQSSARVSTLWGTGGRNHTG